MKKIILFYTFFIVCYVFCSFSEYMFTSRTKALGDTFVGIADSIDSILYNPAGLDTLKTPQVLLGYQSLWTGLTEGSISAGVLNFCYPIKNILSFGLGYVNYMVADLYQENSVLVTLSKSLSKKMFLGLNLKYLFLQYSNVENFTDTSLFSIYGNQQNNFSLDFATLIKFSDKFSLGLSAFDINQPKISIDPDVKEFLPLKIKFGVGFYPVKDLICGVDINYSETVISGSLGIEKNFVNEDLSLRGGINYNNKQTGFFAAGFGYKFFINFAYLQLNYTFAYPISQLSSTIGDHSINLLLDFSLEQKREIVEIKQKVSTVQKVEEEIKKSIQQAKIKLSVSKDRITKEDKNISFDIEISTDIHIEGWQMLIVDNKQRVVKKFFSSNQKEQITWDLKDESGKYIPQGKYNFMVTCLDKKGNKYDSEIKSFFVVEKLQEEQKERKTIICPSCGSEVMEEERFCPVCREPLYK